MVVGCLIVILARSCWHLAVAAVKLPALLCCDAMLSTVAFLTFPLRLLAAVDRERKAKLALLDRLVGEMQRQMERLVWENRELEEKLGMALKESRAMEEILDEMEEEHDDAFARITLLETQLKALKLENMRLIEHRGKSMWDKKPPATAVHGGESLPASTSRPSNTRKRKDREDEAEEAAAAQEEEGGGGVATEEDSEMSVQMRRGKAVARRRSLVSVGMAAAVGAVVWAADAPCLPLLAGLLATVGVSMCSVARFFLLREEAAAALRGGSGRPASSSSDAVVLLSLNWFLLGVLTSPMLPGAAHAVFPRAARLVAPAVAWFSATAPLSS
uniref:GTD-binding domain-containing protein n=1 Tax=Oryza meridionalis TaxID=40149 RepID=A0A0E0CD99_9ORYZ